MPIMLHASPDNARSTLHVLALKAVSRVQKMRSDIGEIAVDALRCGNGAGFDDKAANKAGAARLERHDHIMDKLCHCLLRS